MSAPSSGRTIGEASQTGISMPGSTDISMPGSLPVRDQSALRQALTHKSRVSETPLRSNERLEFLGDAVLGLVVNEYLYDTFPDRSEGALAKAKAMIVSGPALAAAARRLGLTALLHLGSAEEAMGGRSRSSIVADALEAVIAVIYRESGYAAARDFILATLAPEIAWVQEVGEWRDPKTILQEIRQAEAKTPPVYRVADEQGKPHDRTFTIELLLDSEILGTGIGKSKKEAQQAAAAQALARLHESANG